MPYNELWNHGQSKHIVLKTPHLCSLLADVLLFHHANAGCKDSFLLLQSQDALKQREW